MTTGTRQVPQIKGFFKFLINLRAKILKFLAKKHNEEKVNISTYHHDFSVTSTPDDANEIEIVDADPGAAARFNVLIFCIKLISRQSLTTRTWTRTFIWQTR